MKIDPISLNNTISCYHRPHLNYFISKNRNSQNQKVAKKRKMNLNLNKSTNYNIIEFHPQIESRIISFSKISNSFDKYADFNKENKNQNSYYKIINKTKSLTNSNKKKIYKTNLKFKNISLMNTKYKYNIRNNDFLNNSLASYNNQYSLSKDIAILCKIINSIDYSDNFNNGLSRNNNKKMPYINSRKRLNTNYLEEKKIIKIQRWWKKILYHLYIEKKILHIQNKYRKYIKKKKYFFDIQKGPNIEKIIIIQKAWKKFMKNKCLKDYYFFSFKKYIKPKKEKKLNTIFSSKLIYNINKEKTKIKNDAYYKNIIRNNYISKKYYKMKKINNIIEKIEKLQKCIKNYLCKKKTLDKNEIINKNNSLILNPNYIAQKNYMINNYKYEKNSFFFLNNNINEENQRNNKNKEIIRKLFRSYISLKLSNLFILILKRINIFYFINIFIQRIKKKVNEYIFIKLLNIEKKELNSYSYFFHTIWRNLKINLNSENEISLLLKATIPKFYQKDFTKSYIPYINSLQENYLINEQLYKGKDDELIKYIYYFLEKEKNINLNIKYIINHLNEYNLKNRNIFYITRYIDSLYEDLINNKLIKNETTENIDSCEERYNIQNKEKNNELTTKINKNFSINRMNTYCTKKFSCKFSEYLNKNNIIGKNN